jgi:Short C-terminal domain
MGEELVEVETTGLERLGETLACYRTVVAQVARGSAFRAMEQIGEYTQGERVITFVQALRRDAEKAKVVLILTNQRLFAIDEMNGRICDEHRASDPELLEWKQDLWHGTKLTLRTSRGDRTYKQLMPEKEGLRIAEACGFRLLPESRAALPRDMPADPGYPPRAAFWNIHVYEDRLIDHESRHLPFNGNVEAVCDSAGNIAVTRGRNLAAKGLGTLAFGPIGLFFMGNAKHREVDARELYLLVEGPNWAYTVPFQPDAGAGLRQFAGQINVIAKQHWQRVKTRDGAPAGGSDPVSKLRELARLRDDGVLTEEEFASAKAKLLAEL